jgi:hypothetical protein
MTGISSGPNCGINRWAFRELRLKIFIGVFDSAGSTATHHPAIQDSPHAIEAEEEEDLEDDVTDDDVVAFVGRYFPGEPADLPG